jgi:hypothetical protein
VGYKFSDSIKGQFRSLRKGTQWSLVDTYGEIKQVRREREAREAALRLEAQARVWVEKLGSDRSTELKHVAGNGYTDLYFAGVKDADGAGHGHIRVWDDGREQIVREPYPVDTPGARKDATLLDDNTPDKRL